jgi:CRISPR/Cas system-associated exonuclease Cas4 (RecB family)
MDEISLTGIAETQKERQTIVKPLEEYLWRLNFSKAYEEQQYGGVVERGFHPSGLVNSECWRQLALEFLECPKVDGEWEIPHLTRRVFDNGHSVHERLQGYLQGISKIPELGVVLKGTWKCRSCGKYHGDNSTGPIVEPEVCECSCKSFKYKEWRLRHKELRITGKTDGILQFAFDKSHVLLEIKSINTFSFQNLRGVLDEHKVQINLYMWLSGIHRALFIYEDKNNQRIQEYSVDFDSNVIAPIIKQLEEVNALLDKGLLPDVLPNKNAQKAKDRNKVCKQCVFRDHCETFEIPDWFKETLK